MTLDVPDKDNAGYKITHISPISDGRVMEPRHYKESTGGRERNTAQLLSVQGWDVYLRNKDELPSVTSFDSYVDRGDGREDWQFKRITSSANFTLEKIRRTIREGKRQAERVALFIDSTNVSWDIIEDGVRNAYRRDKNGFIKTIIVYAGNGDYKEYDHDRFA